MLKNPVAEAPNPHIHGLMPILDRDKSGTVRYPAGMKAFTWRVPRALAATHIEIGQATSRSDRYLFPTRLIYRWIQPLSGEAEAYNISHSLGDELIIPSKYGDGNYLIPWRLFEYDRLGLAVDTCHESMG